MWPLLAVVDDHLGDEWLAPLATHLGGRRPDADESRRGRRFGAVRHLADLFDQYSASPARADRRLGRRRRHRRPRHGAAGRCPLAASAVAAAPGSASARPVPAERLPEACARLRDEPGLVELPARLSIFGLTRLAASHTELLDALGAARDVHLFLLHPSSVLWDSVAAHVQPGETRPLPRRRDDSTAALPQNPLLATWGRDARELQLVAGRHAATDIHHPVDNRRRHVAASPPGRHPRRPGTARRFAPGRGRRPPAPRRHRPQHPGPLVPRAAPPGRGAARRPAAPARRRSDARAARRHRHVPGHRGVRPVDPRHVRLGRGRRRGAEPTRRRRAAGSASPPRRPLAAPDQCRPRGRRRPAGHSPTAG